MNYSRLLFLLRERSVAKTMTRPKKWHLDEEGGRDIILKYPSGPIKKRNDSVLGPILKILLPSEETRGKLSEEEALLVSNL